MESVRNYVSIRMDAYGTTLPISGASSEDTTINESNSKPESAFASGNFRNTMDNLMKKFETMGTSRITHDRAEESAMSRIKTECIIFLLRLLFGRETDDDLSDSTDYDKDGNRVSYGTGGNTGTGRNRGSSVTGSIRPVSLGHEEHYFAEYEDLSYKTTGKVVTKDGREIDFNLEFSMSRSFETFYKKDHNTDSLRLRDPLVINLDSDIAGVTDQKFRFDIDSDGVYDNISMPAGGSGFLALDRNNDGIINDGSELFGTKSGDGFRDLAAYESDGNGWIDEADPVFKQLKIISANGDGTTSVYGLASKGVGAIYLGSITSDYSLMNSRDNSMNAMIRRTGMFLYENGTAGTVQHLDVAS